VRTSNLQTKIATYSSSFFMCHSTAIWAQYMYTLHCILNWIKFSREISTSRSCKISSCQVLSFLCTGSSGRLLSAVTVRTLYNKHSSTVWQSEWLKLLHTTKFSITRLFAVAGTENGWIVVTRERLCLPILPLYSP